MSEKITCMPASAIWLMSEVEEKMYINLFGPWSKKFPYADIRFNEWFKQWGYWGKIFIKFLRDNLLFLLMVSGIIGLIYLLIKIF